MLRLIYEHPFHSQQGKGIDYSLPHLKPLRRVRTLFPRMGQQRQVSHAVVHCYMTRAELIQNLAVVIQTRGSTNVFRRSLDLYYWHTGGVGFFGSTMLRHTLEDR